MSRKNDFLQKLLPIFFTAFLLVSCSKAISTKGSKNSEVAIAIKNQGEIYLAQEQYTAAFYKFIEALKITSKDPVLYNDLGLTYMGKKKYDLAIKAFQKALAIKPNYMEAINNLGGAYFLQESWDLAIETFSELIDNLLYATPHFPLSNIGWAYIHKKDFYKAELYFEKALEIAPSFEQALHGLAQTYIRSGRIDSAIAFLSECIINSKEKAIFYADLAHAYKLQGKVDEAKYSWNMVRRLAKYQSNLAKQAELHLYQLNQKN